MNNDFCAVLQRNFSHSSPGYKKMEQILDFSHENITSFHENVQLYSNKNITVI